MRSKLPILFKFPILFTFLKLIDIGPSLLVSSPQSITIFNTYLSNIFQKKSGKFGYTDKISILGFLNFFVFGKARGKSNIQYVDLNTPYGSIFDFQGFSKSFGISWDKYFHKFISWICIRTIGSNKLVSQYFPHEKNLVVIRLKKFSLFGFQIILQFGLQVMSLFGL